MMDKNLIKDLEKLEQKYRDRGIDVILFSTDEALEFLNSDIKCYNKLIDKEIKRYKTDPHCPNEFITGLEASKNYVSAIFGARNEIGF